MSNLICDELEVVLQLKVNHRASFALFPRSYSKSAGQMTPNIQLASSHQPPQGWRK
jgi:hypothetical protein